MASRNRWTKGDIYSIKLSPSEFGFCRLLDFPIAEFFNIKSDRENIEFKDIITDVLFRVWIERKSINSPLFRKIGHKKYRDSLSLNTYRYDELLDEYRIYDGETGINHLATKEDAMKFERAAVYGDIHLVERIKANIAGQKSKWEFK
jgi:hypothetical protein